MTTTKWASDAGPIQTKRVESAIRDVTWEGRTHDERTGVIGGDDSTHTFTDLFGPIRLEVACLLQSVGERFGWSITRANHAEIVAALGRALEDAKTSRPTIDNRRTPDEETERNAKVTARLTEERERQDADHAMRDHLEAKRPTGAAALIVAELKRDTSDIMTDYFANFTERRIAIGWRFGKREDFRQLHAAASLFAETASVTFTEHRDNYSMGGGNYLSDHGWDGAGSGWVVRSMTSPYGVTEDALQDRAGTDLPAVTTGGVTVRPSSIGRDGVVEVIFDAKPPPEVIAGLKAHGFRWARSNGCWYGRDTAYAASLTEEVAR